MEPARDPERSEAHLTSSVSHRLEPAREDFRDSHVKTWVTGSIECQVSHVSIGHLVEELTLQRVNCPGPSFWIDPCSIR